MSLEQALADNTAAMKELTAALKGAKTPAAGGGKADAAIEEAAKKKVAADAKKKGVTLEKVTEAFGDYLAAGGDKDLREERKAKVIKLYDSFGVKRASLLEESQWADALAALNKLLAAEQDGDGDGDGEGDSLV